ncbi:hypothetical protein B0T22DRAFT_444549 [Podospora appendiculata]|uniref:Uncharacterized protein n=1 Tax=Podospora appendiculata TaxID=314037 RepID=A0AAE0X0T0_9PEZI|nr:hypothetical protein B0T22DRAFT_444549 [Podospora appendiculata]
MRRFHIIINISRVDNLLRILGGIYKLWFLLLQMSFQPLDTLTITLLGSIFRPAYNIGINDGHLPFDIRAHFHILDVFGSLLHSRRASIYGPIPLGYAQLLAKAINSPQEGGFMFGTLQPCLIDWNTPWSVGTFDLSIQRNVRNIMDIILGHARATAQTQAVEDVARHMSVFCKRYFDIRNNQSIADKLEKITTVVKKLSRPSHNYKNYPKKPPPARPWTLLIPHRETTPGKSGPIRPRLFMDATVSVTSEVVTEASDLQRSPLIIIILDLPGSGNANANMNGAGKNNFPPPAPMPSTNEVAKTLWMGEMGGWMDENFIKRSLDCPKMHLRVCVDTPVRVRDRGLDPVAPLPAVVVTTIRRAQAPSGILGLRGSPTRKVGKETDEDVFFGPPSVAKSVTGDDAVKAPIQTTDPCVDTADIRGDDLSVAIVVPDPPWRTWRQFLLDVSQEICSTTDDRRECSRTSEASPFEWRRLRSICRREMEGWMDENFIKNV